ncbi:hypothetical protein Q1695_000119 [Nippostrongylus brasiliensis]|nr:hypothetical protein Q1695_000119 [Nippostrongylus brasiliensis]
MAVVSRRCALLILIHGALCQIEPTSPPESQQAISRYYEINVENLQAMWHNAMIRGLIKARAKELLSVVPRIEAVVYEQCVKDAKTTVALAKCAVRVFDARDNMQIQAEEQEKSRKQAKPVFRIVAERRSNNSPKWSYFEKSKVADSPPFDIYPGPHKANERSPIRSQTRKRRLPKRTLTKSSDETKLKLDKYIHSLIQSRSLIEKRKAFLRDARNRQRSKRKIDDDFISAAPSLNLQKIVAKYIGKAFGGPSNTSNLENLRLIHEHFQRAEKINNYFKNMNEENRRLYEKFALPLDSRTPEVSNSAQSAVEQVLNVVNSFVAAKSSPGKLSVLSPRLLSLFPESSRASAKRLLSPTFFSFQKDGYLSLPDVFDIITSNQNYQKLMLDVVLDVSGAGAVLEELVAGMKPEIEELKNQKLPLIEELSRRDDDWIRAHNSFNEDQLKDYKEKGYTFMDTDQLNLVYSEQDQILSGINVTKLANMSKEEKARRLENDIRELAALDRPKWPMWDSVHSLVKRHATDQTEISSNSSEPLIPTNGTAHHAAVSEGDEEEERINGILYETFRPFAFNSIVSRGGAMEVVTLSPHAFVAEVANPEALLLETLSPRAFIATILSPAALIARILSPTALRAEVLSPRALHAWILSPEAMVAEVLTPRFFDPRILSPEALVIDVLSPGFLSPHVLSSESVGVIVLSPNILSPRIASEEKLLVEILSPHILGGPHTHEEASHEVAEIGSHSPTRSSNELEHQAHEAIHRGHGQYKEAASQSASWGPGPLLSWPNNGASMSHIG